MCMAIDIIRKNNSRDFIILDKGNQIGGLGAIINTQVAAVIVWYSVSADMISR